MVQQLDQEKLCIAEAELCVLEATGIVGCSNSPLPLYMGTKKHGSWHRCGNYQGLNIVIDHARSRLCWIFLLLQCCTVFLVVDLTKGYHQVPMM